MTDSTGRSVPPGFIIDSCKCIESLLRSKGIAAAVEPEALRRLRSGRPAAEDTELVNVLLEDLSSVSQQCKTLVQREDQAAFLMLCWWITRNGSWQELLADTAPHLSRSQLSIPSSAAAGIEADSKTVDADVVSMKYRTVVQMLNQYHELDRSRVMIFKDIHQILTDIAKLPEAAGAASTTADGTETEFSLSHSALARVLDNLWTAATLVDSSHTSASSSVPSSGKQSSTAAASRGGGSAGSAMGSGKRGSGRSAQRVAGADLLRTEHDALRQWCSEAQQYAASEAAFLRWASAAAEPGLLRTTRLPAPPAATCVQASGGNDAKPPPSPQQLSGAASASGINDCARPGAGDSTNEETHAGELDKIVYKSIPMMGELEQCMLELAELGALSFDEICAASSAMDSSYDDLGLTVEKIDEYFKTQENNCGRINDHAHKLEDGSADTGEREVNIFELLDSECGDDWGSTGAAGVGKQGGEIGNAQRRQLQQQLRLPVLPAQRELEGLRQLHEHTLRRTAKACEKFSPFEMVWSKEAPK